MSHVIVLGQVAPKLRMLRVVLTASNVREAPRLHNKLRVVVTRVGMESNQVLAESLAPALISGRALVYNFALPSSTSRLRAYAFYAGRACESNFAPGDRIAYSGLTSGGSVEFPLPGILYGPTSVSHRCGGGM